MGAASCKSLKLPADKQLKNDKSSRTIVLAVFGLDDAGKTSVIKAIQGEPTDDTSPTIGYASIHINYQIPNKGGFFSKNKSQLSIEIIDLSGRDKSRKQLWSKYYEQIHGFIYVIDASKKSRLSDSASILEELLEQEELKNKPFLILANKQDKSKAVKDEENLKRELYIEELNSKYKIEFSTALPQEKSNKINESIQNGFSWLIRTIDDDYATLNSRVTKIKGDSSKRFNENKNENNRKALTKITLEKLPSIRGHQTNKQIYNGDDDDEDVNHHEDDDKYTSLKSTYKNKITPTTTSAHNPSSKNSYDKEPKAFRSTYESFPEETPWLLSSTSTTKLTSTHDRLPNINTKSALTNDTRRRDMSPLIHDTIKSYSTISASNRNGFNDDDNNNSQQAKSKSLNRFENSSPSINKFASNVRTNNADKGRYDDDDAEENNYPKASVSSKTSKLYDSDNHKSYYRSYDSTNNVNDYHQLIKKSTSYTHNSYEDDDRPLSSSRKENLTKYNDNKKYDDDNDDDDRNNYHLTNNKSKLTYHSTKYNDEDDDNNNNNNYNRKPISKSTTSSRFDYNNYSSSSSKTNTRLKYEDDDDENQKTSKFKSSSYSKFEDDDYPSVPISSSALKHKYDDNDDDDNNNNNNNHHHHHNSGNYSSSYNKHNQNSTVRSRFEDDDDFFTSKSEKNHIRRFQKANGYDS